MQVRELRYFVALAEEHHFGRAAKRLYMAQSGLSKAIKRTERQLGVTLFARTSHEVQLTAAGEALLAHAREVIASFEALERSAGEAARGLTGTLRIATAPAVRHRIAPALTTRFAASHPRVRLIRREQPSGEAVAGVADRDLDAAIALLPPRHPELRSERIAETALKVVINSSHPLARRGEVALAELADEPFLVSGAAHRPEVDAFLAPLFRRAGFRPRLIREPIGYNEDFDAVREGRGVRLSARTFLGGPPAGVSVLALQDGRGVPVEVLWRADERSPALSRFLATVRRVSREEGWSLGSQGARRAPVRSRKARGGPESRQRAGA